MKRGFFLILCCGLWLSSNGQRPTKLASDFVRIDLIGPHDKPWASLVITTIRVKLDTPIEQEILVSKEVFNVVYKFFSENRNVSLEGAINEFGIFKATTQISGQKVVFYFPTRLKSIQIFKDLRSKLAGLETADRLIKETTYALFYIGVRETDK